MDPFNFRKASLADLEKIIRLLADDQLGQKREQSLVDKPNAYKKTFNQILVDPNLYLMISGSVGRTSFYRMS